MRSRKTRIALACTASIAIIGLCGPAAWAETPTPTPTTTTTPTEAPLVDLSGDSTATPTETATTTSPVTANTSSPTEETTTPAPKESSPSPSPTAIGLNLPIFIDNVRVSSLPSDLVEPITQLITAFGIQIPDINSADIPPAPFVLHSTCVPGGTAWTVTNTADHELGLGWFGSDIKGGIGTIGAGQTLPLDTKDFLVLAMPFNTDGTYTPALPAIGLSTCAGPIPSTISASAATPEATPADAVTAQPHYTG